MSIYQPLEAKDPQKNERAKELQQSLLYSKSLDEFRSHFEILVINMLHFEPYTSQQQYEEIWQRRKQLEGTESALTALPEPSLAQTTAMEQPQPEKRNTVQSKGQMTKQHTQTTKPLPAPKKKTRKKTMDLPSTWGTCAIELLYKHKNLLEIPNVKEQIIKVCQNLEEGFASSRHGIKQTDEDPFQHALDALIQWGYSAPHLRPIFSKILSVTLGKVMMMSGTELQCAMVWDTIKKMQEEVGFYREENEEDEE